MYIHIYVYLICIYIYIYIHIIYIYTFVYIYVCIHIYIYTIFMNSKNSKTSDPHRLLLILTDKVLLKINISLYQISTFTIRGKIQKKSYKSNEFNISAPT